ncbi:MAG: ABC transporter permease subunit [Candidatus Hydrogenedentes bacterium]|nr:ABC transporter permease subunit [Candidatus Hydrogenedentota bacterium]
MNRIFAVADNTFRESIRDKVLYVLLFFAAATILGSKVLGWISIGQDIKIIKDICLASMSLFGVLISIFIGTSLVYKEIDKKTLYTILAQPLHRYEFVLGKYLGLLLVLALSLLIMTGVSTVYLVMMGGVTGVIWFQAIFLIYLKLVLITAFAIFMSALVSPIMGAVIVFFLYVLGHATEVLRNLPPQFEGTASEKILEIVYFVVPNLNTFNLQSEAANNVPVASSFVIFALLYGLAWTAMLLILACLTFEGRDV